MDPKTVKKKNKEEEKEKEKKAIEEL